MSTLTYTGRLQITSCWCGIPLAIPVELYDEARKRTKTIYCPLGHAFIYGNTWEERNAELERQLSATRDLLDHEEASHRATRGHLTRKKKQLDRVGKGICPCCNRTFQNLARHMMTKHPDYSP